MEVDAAENSEAKPVVEEDIRCLQCGYSLRGIPFEGVCPECGMQVKLSTHHRYGLTAKAFATICLRLFGISMIIIPFVGDYGLITTLLWYIIDGGGGSFQDWLFYLISPGSKIVLGIVLIFVAPILASLIAPLSMPFIANAGGPRLILALVASLFAMWLVVTGGELIITGIGIYTFENMEQNSPNSLQFSSQRQYPVLFVTGLFRMVTGIFMLGWLLKRKELHGWARLENA